MFRELRRNKQLLTMEECIEILNNATSGILAVTGDDGYPYAVPVSFAYNNDKIYFHCAKEGHKIDSINRNEKVSFCVIDKDEVIPEKYTTYFRSVIIFGKAHIVEDETDKLKSMNLLAEKYNPSKDGLEHEIDSSFDHMFMVEVNIDYMSGKEAIELARKKESH